MANLAMAVIITVIFNFTQGTPLLSAHDRRNMRADRLEYARTQDRIRYAAEFLQDNHYIRQNRELGSKTTAQLRNIIVNPLKRFQEFHDITQSGDLDAATVDALLSRRCSIPDFEDDIDDDEDGTTLGVSSIRNKRQLRRAGINTPIRNAISNVVAQYFTGNIKPWNRAAITYSIGAIPQKYRANANDIRKHIRTAVRQWAGISGMSITPAASGARANIRFTFARIDIPWNTLGRAFFPQNGLVEFDTAESWDFNGGSRGPNFKVTAIHEMGHAMGLPHTKNVLSIMYPALNGRNNKFTTKDVTTFRSAFGKSALGSTNVQRIINGLIAQTTAATTASPPEAQPSATRPRTTATRTNGRRTTRPRANRTPTVQRQTPTVQRQTPTVIRQPRLMLVNTIYGPRLQYVYLSVADRSNIVAAELGTRSVRQQAAEADITVPAAPTIDATIPPNLYLSISNVVASSELTPQSAGSTWNGHVAWNPQSGLDTDRFIVMGTSQGIEMVDTTPGAAMTFTQETTWVSRTSLAQNSAQAFRGGLPSKILTSGNNIHVIDSSRNCIQTVGNNGVTLLAGTCGAPGDIDGNSNLARFNNPVDMCNIQGNIYILDKGNSKIRVHSLQTSSVSTYATLSTDVTYESMYCTGSDIYLTGNTNSTSNIYKVQPSTLYGNPPTVTMIVSVVRGTGASGSITSGAASAFGPFKSLVVNNGQTVILNDGGLLRELNLSGGYLYTICDQASTTSGGAPGQCRISQLDTLQKIGNQVVGMDISKDRLLWLQVR